MDPKESLKFGLLLLGCALVPTAFVPVLTALYMAKRSDPLAIILTALTPLVAASIFAMLIFFLQHKGSEPFLESLHDSLVARLASAILQIRQTRSLWTALLVCAICCLLTLMAMQVLKDGCVTVLEGLQREHKLVISAQGFTELEIKLGGLFGLSMWLPGTAFYAWRLRRQLQRRVQFRYLVLVVTLSFTVMRFYNYGLAFFSVEPVQRTVSNEILSSPMAVVISFALPIAFILLQSLYMLVFSTIAGYRDRQVLS